MMEELIRELTKVGSRRGFLGKAASACAAIALAILGLDKVTMAQKVPCCGLCMNGGDFSGCASTWCWFCCTDTNPHKYWKCSECFSVDSGACHGCWPDFSAWRTQHCSCDNVKASKAELIGEICA
jgi:hypothetical protein